jgi:hypothetical protein
LAWCHKIEEFSGVWWPQAEHYKVQRTDAIIDDVKQLREKVVPDLKQQQCNILVIGDTGAGEERKFSEEIISGNFSLRHVLLRGRFLTNRKCVCY